MPIKLLALDIDGTLLTPNGEITARNSAAISRASQFGVQIVLVTGRRFNSARELAQRLDMGAPLISHNGALTKNVETLETLDYHPLDIGIARAIIGIGRECEADMICCDDPHGLGKMVIEGVSDDNKSLHRYLDNTAIRSASSPTCSSMSITRRSRSCFRAGAIRWTISPL